MTTREILEDARDAFDGGATQGCLWTAVSAAAAGLNFIELLAGGYKHCFRTSEQIVEGLSVIAIRLDPKSMGAIHFNDSHTHAEVLELFNLAIADEIAKEGAHGCHMTEEQEREQAEDPAAPLVFA